jgi:hypothetical protein
MADANLSDQEPPHDELSEAPLVITRLGAPETDEVGLSSNDLSGSKLMPTVSPAHRRALAAIDLARLEPMESGWGASYNEGLTYTYAG